MQHLPIHGNLSQEKNRNMSSKISLPRFTSTGKWSSPLFPYVSYDQIIISIFVSYIYTYNIPGIKVLQVFWGHARFSRSRRTCGIGFIEPLSSGGWRGRLSWGLGHWRNGGITLKNAEDHCISGHGNLRFCFFLLECIAFLEVQKSAYFWGWRLEENCWWITALWCTCIFDPLYY